MTPLETTLDIRGVEARTRLYLKGPPVFVSKFVLTYVRVLVRGYSLRVEFWEHPKPAEQRLSKIERLLSWNRRPSQPPADTKPRVRDSSVL